MFFADFGNIDELRIWLKGYTVIGVKGYEREAELINRLMPAMVDSLTDDELIELYNQAIENSNKENRQ